MTETEARDRVYFELANRSVLMAIHGIVAILIGATMMATGAPAPIEATFGPWSRLVLGGWAVAHGLVIVAGVAISRGRLTGWVALLVGCLGLLVWHATLMLAYGVAAFEDEILILAPGESLAAGVVNRGYIPFVYLGYVMLVGAHLITLLRLGPPRR